jgi:hypothetical protein
MNSGNPVRLEMRKLKHELFSDTEHSKFFPTKSPVAPSAEAYNAIIEDKRILHLSRYIKDTAIYFENQFQVIESSAERILDYIDEIYN